jgi:hypothetical protein
LKARQGWPICSFQNKTNKASSQATSLGERTEYAADGAWNYLRGAIYNDAAPMALK